MSTKALWKTFMLLSLLSIQAFAALSQKHKVLQQQTTQSDKLSQSDKKFSDCTVGQTFAHKNTAGHVKMLICAEKINGVPRWQYTDGSSTFGEVFNPAKDCADIVDYTPDAQNGFYWIKLNNKTKQKVWCDVHTDGGGFMLVGMKDSPKSWTVPSNFTPVDPLGPPHWSSVLGHIEVLDFRVQFSTDKHFERTKADWMYRLQPQRELGNLFSINDGCPYLQAGITNISFVKDLRTDSVITHNFKCSKFGQHVHHTFGWGKMNYCLRNVCKYGYGVLVHGVPIVIDKFGSYSYSAVSSFSGMNHNSTAFVGCDQGECCACYGPKGGRKNYCGSKCTSFNGGTVIKKAFVWFWVRTRMPTRLWERCMEFTIRNAAGKHEKYFIDPKTGTLHKGSCSKQYKAFLNEGTLTVSDKESFEKIPDVPGLLSYRTDKKKLYVNQGSHWKAMSSEHEVHQLRQKVKFLENMIKGLVNRTDMLYPTTCSILRNNFPSTRSGAYYLKPQGLASSPLVQVYCDMTSKNGVGVTVIGHDSESRTYVKGYDAAGSYKRKIKYDISMEEIVAIMKQSRNCEQFIKYQCFQSVFRFDSSGTYYSWWVSRQGSQMNYWGGAAVNSGKCACGMTNSCAGGKSCNCDENDNAWREDSGYLTDKNTLPVSELRFGDAQGNKAGSGYESGYHTLGKLRCWG